MDGTNSSSPASKLDETTSSAGADTSQALMDTSSAGDNSSPSTKVCLETMYYSSSSYVYECKLLSLLVC